MDVRLIPALLPRGALWIRWTWTPVNPLIELSVPEEETMRGVSGWLQKHGCRSRVSRSQLILPQSRRRLIPASSRRAGTGAIQSRLSLEPFHLFSLRDGGGHVSTRLPRNSPHPEVCSFLLRLWKSSSLMTPQGAPASISWLCCLVSSSHRKRTLCVACFFYPGRTNPTYFCPYFYCIRASSARKTRPWNHERSQWNSWGDSCGWQELLIYWFLISAMT